MVQGVAEGHQTVTDRTFKALTASQLDQCAFEIERQLRDIRGNQAAVGDLAEIKRRNIKIQRLNSARTIMRSYRQRSRT